MTRRTSPQDDQRTSRVQGADADDSADDSADDRSDDAARAWRLMFDIFVSSSGSRTASLARRQLTPNDARALWSLDPQAGRPIGELAREWSCDPSNATFIVDRLEKAGLAQRQALASDRRVKLVVLTAAGAATRVELQDEYHRPPPEILALPGKDLKALARILDKARRAPGRS